MGYIFGILIVVSIVAWISEALFGKSKSNKDIAKNITSVSLSLKDVEQYSFNNSEKTFEEIKLTNQEALYSFLSFMKDKNASTDNKTMEFLGVIYKDINFFQKTHPDFGTLYYYSWLKIPTLPIGVRKYSEYVKAEIENRKILILSDEKLARDREEQLTIDKVLNTAQEIINRNSDKVNKFHEITYRKVTTVDDYGDENPKVVNEEINRLIKKFAETEPELHSEVSAIFSSIFSSQKKSKWEPNRHQHPISIQIISYLKDEFNKYYQKQKTLAKSCYSADEMNSMNGIDFENYIMQLLRNEGVSIVAGTAKSGDQGADVMFTHRGKKIVIQAKRYADATVSNSAVQEVHAARGFYKYDEAWVITNSRFSPSAKTAAQKLDVVLIDGTDLERFSFFFKNYFNKNKSA